MSLSINEVMLAGNLTADAEYRTSQSGNTVCNFAIAVSKRVKDNAGNWIDDSDFINCILFGKLGEAFRNNNSLTKGTPVAISGRLTQERWQDKETGKNRSAIKVVADTVIPYQRANNQQQQYNQQPQQSWPTQQQQYNQPPQGFNQPPAGAGYQQYGQGIQQAPISDKDIPY